jgi:hypothetical protein
MAALLETGEDIDAKKSEVGVVQAKFGDRARTAGIGMQGNAYCRSRQTLSSIANNCVCWWWSCSAQSVLLGSWECGERTSQQKGPTSATAALVHCW